MSHASRTHDHTEEGRQAYNHFTYRTYKKDGEACTGHYIRECVLDEIVLEDLRRATSAAREHPEKFAAYIGSKQSAELQREIRRQEKELAAMRKRKAELDVIFKKLYEDNVLGSITTEQFQMLSGSYTEEQNRITAGIPQKENEIQRLRETVSGTDSFLDKAKRYTDITELTPELLRLFIEKIVVHEKEVKWSKHAPQTVEIYYNGIGYVGSGQQDVEEALEALEMPTHAFIGGSTGQLKEIIQCIKKKNPDVRIVINAISLETVKEAMEAMEEGLLADPEIIQLNVAKSKKLGRYHMMTGLNPIYIISDGGDIE